MSASTVRARLLASALVGFNTTLAAGWSRAGSAKVGTPVAITAPASATVTQGQPTAISGVSVSDSNVSASTITVTLTDTNGLLSATGAGVSGSGTTSLSVTDTISNANADLATLADTDSTLASDTIAVTATDGTYSASPATIGITVACYLRGTMIATPAGERSIESLAIGDFVLTAAGKAEPIRWIGRRAYNTRFARANPDVVPVRIAAGALADGIPGCDLYVSPLHAMLLDGVLVQATDLVNGVTIAPAMPSGEIEYFHIELAEHAVLLANRALSESFVDDDSRMMFHNAYDYFAMYPGAERRPAVYCAPRVLEGPKLDAIRRRIAGRALAVGLNQAA